MIITELITEDPTHTIQAIGLDDLLIACLSTLDLCEDLNFPFPTQLPTYRHTDVLRFLVSHRKPTANVTMRELHANSFLR